MARIGILTMQLKENIGGILQAYALYSLVEQMGHTPYLFRLSVDDSKLKGIVRSLFQKNPFYKILDVKKLGNRFQNSRSLRDFVDKAFPNKTKEVISQEDFEIIGNQFDAIIVGSDQVWRYAYTRDDIEKYFLKGIDDHVTKIAYAASFGVSEWESQDNMLNERLSQLLSDFDFVSVREQSGLHILESTFGYSEGVVCLDPTLLHDSLFYSDIIVQDICNSKQSIRNDYLFAYILDLSEEKIEWINDYAKKRSLVPIFASIPAHLNSLAPFEWIQFIRGAKYILTDSFHGAVFSILFKKPFTATLNMSRGSTRFENLFSYVGNKRYVEHSYIEVIPTEADLKNIRLLAVESKELLSKHLSNIIKK